MAGHNRLAPLAVLIVVLAAMAGSAQGLDCDTTINSTSASFTSPGYPDDYPNGVYCVTRIRRDVKSKFLVRFRDFKLEFDQGCDSYDYVRIYTTTGEPSSLVRAATPVRVLCGSTLDGAQLEFSWVGLGLDIIFKTDYSNNLKGFAADVYIQDFDLTLTASTFATTANSAVVLECQLYNLNGSAAVPIIANTTWNRDDAIMEGIHDSVIKVTSDIAGDVSFSCLVTLEDGRNYQSMTTFIEFDEDIPDCSKTITTKTARITSPGFPVNYKANQLCVTRLRGDLTTRFLVRFRSFKLEYDFGCDGTDNVWIYTVAGEPSSLMRAAEPSRRMCGTSAPDFSWQGLGLDIVFKSDDSAQYQGYEADVFLTSPLDPDELAVFLTSSTFETTINSIVTLECQAIDFDNASASVPVANITWTRDNTIMEGMHNSVIKVTSDIVGDVSFNCFVVDINGRNGSDDVVVEFKFTDDCDTMISTPGGRITSLGFPDSYPHDTMCITRLRSDVKSTYLVRFLNFTLEESVDCVWDYVKIYSVTGEPPSLERGAEPLRVLCGTLAPEEMELSWEGFGLDIVFKSDYITSYAGFEAEVLISSPDNADPMYPAIDLTLKRDMIFGGDGGRFGTLTCDANGNDVNVESVTLSWIKQTGERIDLLTVTKNTPDSSFPLDGMLGNGALQNNSGYIFIDQMEAAACESSYFICEATYTTQSGVRGRAIATAGHPGQDRSNSTQALAAAQEKLSHLSAVFQVLNGSYARLLEEKQEIDEARANFSAKISELENKLDQRQSCEPCSNITTLVEDLQRRLEVLENSTVTTQALP